MEAALDGVFMAEELALAVESDLDLSFVELVVWRLCLGCLLAL